MPIKITKEYVSELEDQLEIKDEEIELLEEENMLLREAMYGIRRIAREAIDDIDTGDTKNDIKDSE